MYSCFFLNGFGVWEETFTQLFHNFQFVSYSTIVIDSSSSGMTIILVCRKLFETFIGIFLDIYYIHIL